MNMAVSGRGQQGLIGVVKQQPPTQPIVLVLAPPQPNWQANVPTMQVRKRQSLFGRFYTKTDILPRQARDKHRKNSKKVAFSCSDGDVCLCAV